MYSPCRAHKGVYKVFVRIFMPHVLYALLSEMTNASETCNFLNYNCIAQLHQYPHHLHLSLVLHPFSHDLIPTITTTTVTAVTAIASLAIASIIAVISIISVVIIVIIRIIGVLRRARVWWIFRVIGIVLVRIVDALVPTSSTGSRRAVCVAAFGLADG